MRYLFALLLPPFAVLSCGKIFQFVVSLLIEAVAILFVFLFFPVGIVVHLVAVIHGFVVVHGRHADKRTDRIVEAVQSAGSGSP